MELGNIISIIFGVSGVITFTLTYIQSTKRDTRSIDKEEFTTTSSINTNIEFIKKQLEELSSKITNMETEIKKNTLSTSEILVSLKEQTKTLFNRMASAEHAIEQISERLRKLENGTRN